jgi:predicted RNA-binding protein with TRAM domain
MSYGNRGYGGGGRGGGYGGGRGGGFGGPKPVEAGKEYEVQISEISRQGDGIARIQGFVIFVKGGRVGEKTKVRINNVGPRFATGEKVASTTAQPEESEAPASVPEEEKPNLQDYDSKKETPEN